MEGTDNQNVTSRLDELKNKLRSRYPEQEFNSDEDFSSRISDDYDDFDNQLKGYKEREEKISGLFTRDPESARFMHNWANGGDPRIELMRAYGKEGIMAALDDPDKAEEMAEANKEFVENAAKEKALVEEYQKNLQESAENSINFAEENGYTEEQVDEAMHFLVNLSRDIIMGKFSSEALTSAMHALNYDKDVEEANYVGEVRGKNAAIVAKLRKPKGDGVPNLAGNSAGMGRPSVTLPGALGRERKDIWAQGGFKRIPRNRG